MNRRFYFDEFLESDGPFWISIGLYIDDAVGEVSDLDRVTAFADASLEMTRYLLDRMIEREVVVVTRDHGMMETFALAPRHAATVRRYLDAQTIELARFGQTAG